MAKKTFERSVIPDENCSRSTMDRMKLCGYLRKKRTKIGGWRKLWFVLHDRLLLSYASKEEYDNKLVSFKDVLNLVPGTQIRPMDGHRFTIETTTQVIYTFHCDDHIAYREWIAMLMDSAGSALNCSRTFQRFVHDPMKIKNCDLLNGAERNVSRKPTSVDKRTFNRNEMGRSCISREIIRKPWMNNGRNESQTLKKQIERMSISGNEDYRLLAFTTDFEKHNRFELVTTQNTEHFLIQQPQVEENSKEQGSDHCEPVYAVVDLKNKYDQRKKRSELIEAKRCSSYESIYRMERDNPNGKERSLESLDAIYEDGDLFFNGNSEEILKNSMNQSREIEENIYEPINVAQKTSMFEFRKYISRLNLNPFLRSPATQARTDTRDQPNNAMSRFSTLRWKLGKHRKSVQRRMRKLYSKEYEPNPLFQYQTDDISVDIRKEDAANSSNNEITKTSNNNKEFSNEGSTKSPTGEESAQKCENLLPFKNAVAKIPLLNISSFKNSHQ